MNRGGRFLLLGGVGLLLVLAVHLCGPSRSPRQHAAPTTASAGASSVVTPSDTGAAPLTTPSSAGASDPAITGLLPLSAAKVGAAVEVARRYAESYFGPDTSIVGERIRMLTATSLILVITIDASDGTRRSYAITVVSGSHGWTISDVEPADAGNS